MGCHWLGEDHRYSFDRLPAEDYNAIVVSWYAREDAFHPASPSKPSLGTRRLSTRYDLPSRDGLRFAGRETLSSVIGDGAINNGTAVNTFPCIEHEKKIREPFQHHHTLALRTFH